MNEEFKTAGYICVGIIIGMLFTILYTNMNGGAAWQKCAETQGKYDFCVQKVNWEGK